MVLTFHKRSKYSLEFEVGWGSYRPHPILIITFVLGMIMGVSCQNSRTLEDFKSPSSPLYSTIMSIPTPAPGYGVIQGRIVRPLNTSSPLFVYFARITWDPDRRTGAYVLDSSNQLWTKVNPDGSFYLKVPQGDYVVFVGISLESAVPLQETSDRLYIVNVPTDHIVDIGTWDFRNSRW